MGALLTFKVDVDPASGQPTKNLTVEAKGHFKSILNLDVKTVDDVIRNPEVNKFIEKCIEKANGKSVSRAAHIRKWKILEQDFSIPGGELTPTLKLKRKVTS